jgi:hypothetical protein
MAQQVCVVLSTGDHEQLAAVAADRNRLRKHIERARIVLASADRHSAQRVAQSVGVSRPTALPVPGPPSPPSRDVVELYLDPLAPGSCCRSAGSRRIRAPIRAKGRLSAAPRRALVPELTFLPVMVCILSKGSGDCAITGMP